MRYLSPVEVHRCQRAIAAAHDDIVVVDATADDLSILAPERMAIGEFPFQLALEGR